MIDHPAVTWVEGGVPEFDGVTFMRWRKDDGMTGLTNRNPRPLGRHLPAVGTNPRVRYMHPQYAGLRDGDSLEWPIVSRRGEVCG